MKIIKLIRFIPQHKREPGGIPQGSVLNAIEAYAVVESEEAEHGQEEAHPDTYAAPQLEGVVIVVVIPAVGRLEESESINSAAGVGSKRITQFEGIFIEYGKELLCLLLVGIHLRVGVL